MRIRYFIACASMLITTGAIGSMALALSIGSIIIPGLRKLAQISPEIWGRAILSSSNEFIQNQKITSFPPLPPPPFLGLTIIICNHPNLEDIPALVGILSRWKFAPAIVSKKENLEGLTGLFVGKPLQLMKRAVFITQNGGKESKKILEESVAAVGEILIFPDQHRPTPNAIKRDKKRFKEDALEYMCVPRGGGVHTLISSAISQKRPIRVFDITWKSDEKNITARWEDVTCRFMIRDPLAIHVLPEDRIREELLDLWREKERRFFKKTS